MAQATVKPTQVSPVREEIVLETKSNVLPFPGTDREWLAREIFSTPYAEILS